MPRAVLIIIALCFPTFAANFTFLFDNEQQIWTLTNGRVQAVFQLTPDGHFLFREFRDFALDTTWPAATRLSSPIRYSVDGHWLDARTAFRLVAQVSRPIPQDGYRQTIVLSDLAERARIRVDVEMFGDFPVLRLQTRYVNLASSRVFLQDVDMLPLQLKNPAANMRTFKVNQWVNGGRLGNFEPITETMQDGQEILTFSGAAAQHCGWMALRDPANRGLFFGWEFDGRAATTATQFRREDRIEFRSEIYALNRPLAPGAEFVAPAAFFGSFRGNWDDAAWQTQRFVEAVIAKPIADPQFPYVMWDSWGYLQDIDDATLRANARIAASLGIEAFIIDLGWAAHIGDWHPDPKKFPSGLKPLSDYVHSLGMKFGLHFALAEAAATSPVLRQNPDWTASFDEGYFEAQSICLGHDPVRQWIVSEAVRIIDDYGVDWILQDGENMVKRCDKTTHTHDPEDANFSNALGLNAIVSRVQQLRPNVHWENCEDGGNMMTYGMVRRYVTSIAADNSGPLTTRRAVHGITYPFSTRYSDRYMQDESLTRYVTRSFMFGGPWIFMNRLPKLTAANLQAASREVLLYKTLRGRIRQGRVFHLTDRPTPGAIDALQSYHPPTDTAIVFAFRENAPENTRTLRLRGVDPQRAYRVHFQDRPEQYIIQGRELLDSGLPVRFTEAYDAVIAYLDPVLE